jgi:hypothetical protein
MERELRIGNLVLTTDVLIPYHRIEPEDLVSMKDGSFKKLGIEIKPIPLTEDILLKCGFKEFGEDFKLGDYTFNLPSKCFCWGLQAGCNSITDSDIINLHQLQNLYFALTNEELEINL